MTMRGIGTIGLAAIGWALACGGPAFGQLAPMPAAPQASGMSPAAMMANPYMNPYLNPYLNPAATQQPMGARDAATYMYMANAANGGMGSGRLGQSLQPKAAPKGARPAKAAALTRASNVPGGGAARFFNPGPVNVNGAGKYFDRRGPRFPNNGR